MTMPPGMADRKSSRHLSQRRQSGSSLVDTELSACVSPVWILAISGSVTGRDESARVTGRLDHSAHRPLGPSHARVGAVAVNLIAAEFGLLPLAGHDDGTTRGIDLNCVIEGHTWRHHKELAKHLNNK